MHRSPQTGRPRTSPWISGIVLAAGRSSRMGSPKPLVRIAGRPLLERMLDALAASRVAEVVVVLGHEAARVTREIDMATARVVVNPEYLRGMSTSIRAGLRAADPAAVGYLLLLGDQPFVASTTLDALLNTWRPDGPRILIPTFRGRRGNPVLVDRALAPEMDRISGDQGFRALFAERAEDILEVAVDDPGILFDMDTPEQVESLEARLTNRMPLHQALTELVTAEPNQAR